MTYNTFAVSVLSFVSQLESPPEAVLLAENAALRKAAPGPAWWAKPEDLWYLKELYGQQRSFKSIGAMAFAAQVRVATWEAATAGGLRVKERARTLRELFNNADYIGRRRAWPNWYANSHILTLENAVSKFEALGTPVNALINDLAGGERQPWSENRTNSIKRHFQQAALRVILMARQPHAEDRIRHKQSRWKLQGLPGANARRVLRRLDLLKSLVTPRVSAAVLSTIYNRWTTARRFQRRTQSCNHCVLGCPGGAEDSIEHYARCHVVRSFGLSFLNFSFSHADALEDFVLAGADIRWSENMKDLTMLAILIYSVYRTTNTARVQGRVSSTIAKQMLGQFVKEAVRGHPISAKVVDQAWSNTNASAVSVVKQPRPSSAATISGRSLGQHRSRSPRRRI
jgi:hypothetical protein